ncbi:MAG TPA: Ig-like domain-containing protein, partial [Accumulibacter sp.]|nr:Ig-like domain-containing protein [Accumulibacter sp.]
MKKIVNDAPAIVGQAAGDILDDPSRTAVVFPSLTELALAAPPVNNAPIANNDSYTARPGQTLAIAAPGFLANDSDPDGDSLTAVSVNITGLQGSLVAFPDGHFNFTPTAGFVGTTSFTYTMGDGFGGNATGTVSINVVNNAPIANNDSYTARPGQTLAIA